MNFTLPRGIRDIDPEEYIYHERVISSFVETANLFGFNLMQPASIENIETLIAKTGPDIEKEIYSFNDKAGRRLGLRFDLTVGITRYVCSRRDIPIPQKIACYGYVWRYDEPQHGRYRSFSQWDIEIFDKNNVESDAEVIEFCYRFFKKIGLNTRIEIGDRKITEQLIKKVAGIKDEKLTEAMRLLDKVRKKTKDELIVEYVEKGFSKENVENLIKLKEIEKESKKAIQYALDHDIDVSEISKLVDALNSRGVENYSLNFSIVRGLDYYTGIVFEVFDAKKEELGSLCGGGRYDSLPKTFGRPDISATGAAGGIERIALSMERKKDRYKRSVLVAYTSEEFYGKAISVMKELRDNGIPSETVPSSSLKKQFEFASSAGIRFILIIGKKEIEENTFTLRDMMLGKELKISSQNLIDAISSQLSKS